MKNNSIIAGARLWEVGSAVPRLIVRSNVRVQNMASVWFHGQVCCFFDRVRCVNPSDWFGKGTKLRSVRATWELDVAVVFLQGSPHCGPLSTLWRVALRTSSQKFMWRFGMGCLQFVACASIGISAVSSFWMLNVDLPFVFGTFPQNAVQFCVSVISIIANLFVCKLFRSQQFIGNICVGSKMTIQSHETQGVFSSWQVWVCFHRNWILVVGVFKFWEVFWGRQNCESAVMSCTVDQHVALFLCRFCQRLFFWFKVCQRSKFES